MKAPASIQTIDRSEQMRSRAAKSRSIKLIAALMACALSGAGVVTLAHRRPTQITRLAQLRNGTFHLAVRRTFPGLSNAGQLADAKAGDPTHPADGRVELWFTVDDAGNVVRLRSRTVSLPEGTLWSETAFTPGSAGVMLRHYQACHDETLTAPNGSAADLLLDFAGPLKPWDAFGFHRSPSGPSTYELSRGAEILEFRPGKTFHDQELRAINPSTSEVVLVQTGATLQGAKADTVSTPLDPLRC